MEARTASRQKRTRVLVIDDQPIVRAGLSAVLGSYDGIRVVGQAGCIPEALDAWQTLHPDIIVIDFHVSPDDVVRAIELIRERDPSAMFVVFACFDTDDFARGCLEAGARGYLPKRARVDELIYGIRAVRAGRQHVAPQVQERLAAHDPSGRLTARQSQVLQHLIHGRSNAAIAAELGINEGTVKSHLRQLFAKLKVSSRAEAMAVAVRRTSIGRKAA